MPFSSVPSASQPRSAPALSARLKQLAEAANDTLAALDAAIEAGHPISSADVLAAADRIGELARTADFTSQLAPPDDQR